MNTRRITTTTLPQFAKSTIGFDKIFNKMNQHLFDNPGAGDPQGNYPPYNVVQITDDTYMVTMAVAGFGMDNIEITRSGNLLQIEGTPPSVYEDVNYLHKGIAGRSFRREFALAENMEITDAVLELGMLNIHLTRIVPEALKPKRIQITHKE